jgi:hypothetical protein
VFVTNANSKKDLKEWYFKNNKKGMYGKTTSQVQEALHFQDSKPNRCKTSKKQNLDNQ